MLILVGFTEEELKKIDDEYYAVPPEFLDWKVEELIEKKPAGEKYVPVEDGKFVIMHDIPKEEISATMKRVRNAVDGHIIFATTTPTSLKWKLADLLSELKEEDAYFHRGR